MPTHEDLHRAAKVLALAPVVRAMAEECSVHPTALARLMSDGEWAVAARIASALTETHVNPPDPHDAERKTVNAVVAYLDEEELVASRLTRARRLIQSQRRSA